LWQLLILLVLVFLFMWIILGRWTPWDHATTDPSEGGCPAGTTLLAKFEWSGGRYKFEKPKGNEAVVFVTGDAKGGTWTSTLPVSMVILKGSAGYAWTTYDPAAFSGTFSNQILPPNSGGQIPDISNIQFCGPEETEAGLRVIKTVDWNGATPDTTVTFNVCVQGPSFPTTADCKVVDFDGDTVSWFNLTPGAYTVSEPGLGSAWEVILPGETIVRTGQLASAEVTNTYLLGSLEVRKTVDWGVTPPDNGQVFEICVEGPSYPAPSCKSAPFDGGTVTWEDVLPGTYTVEEPGVTPEDWAVTIDSSPVTVPEGGGKATVHVRNVRELPPAGNLRVVKVDLGPASASGTWDFTAAGPTTPPPASITNTGDATFSDVAPGIYSVTETTGQGEACTIGLSETGDFETRHGLTGNPELSVPGLTISGVEVRDGETTTVYFFNRNCGTVLASPTLYIQKYEDPAGNRTGTTGKGGVQFVLKRNGIPVGGPLISPVDGLIIVSGLDGGMYTVEEAVPDGYQFTGTRVDFQADGTYDGEYPGQPPEIELLHSGDAAWVTFYNQPRISVKVTKVESANGVPSPGAGWTFTITGCGIDERSGVTGADGTLTFTDLPPASGCIYTVTETLASGWTVSPAASQQAGSAVAGAVVALQFTNVRNVTPTPSPTSTQPPGLEATPTPGETGTPSATATTASPTATMTPSTPAPPPTPTATPDSAVVGETTPRPPISGQSPDAPGSSSVPIVAAGMVLLAVSIAAGAITLRSRRR
jgi:hypothetical protein